MIFLRIKVVAIASGLVFILAFAGVCQGSPVRDLQHVLGLDDHNWKVSKETDSEITWTTPGKEAVTLTINQPPSEMIEPNDQKGLQAVFRDEARFYKGGLVEVQTFDSGGVKCGLVTMKFQMKTFDPKAGDGVAYQMNAIIPLKHTSYVLQVAAAETGVTGVREATVTVIDMKQRNIPDITTEAKDFRRDPYDARFNPDALYTISDDRKWDKSFPDHPLSRIRQLMNELIKTWKLNDQIKGDAMFK